MPKGPKGQKRPADVIGNDIRVAMIATGEITEDVADDVPIGGLRRVRFRFARPRIHCATSLIHHFH
jgi:hypothetical protein